MPFYALTYELLDIALTTCKPVIMRIKYHKGNRRFTDVAEYGMCQALPKDKPTLQSTNTGNWTCPDNVFCTDHTLDSFIICDTAPRLRAPKTDHVPILSTLDLDIPRATVTTSYNYRDVDWEKFSTHIEERLQRIPPPQPIIDLDSFRTAAKDLATALHDVIEDQVPKSRPNPHAKR